MTDEIAQRAIDVQGLLAQHAQHRSVSIPDLLIAATAERFELTILHYDADYDRIAAITGQATEWAVPPAWRPRKPARPAVSGRLPSAAGYRQRPHAGQSWYSQGPARRASSARRAPPESAQARSDLSTSAVSRAATTASQPLSSVLPSAPLRSRA